VTSVIILPGCDAASLDDLRPTFRDSILILSIRVDLYNEETFVPRFDFRRWDHYAVSKRRAPSLSDAAPHPRRTVTPNCTAANAQQERQCTYNAKVCLLRMLPALGVEQFCFSNFYSETRDEYEKYCQENTTLLYFLAACVAVDTTKHAQVFK
jgi:hypothetical protein